MYRASSIFSNVSSTVDAEAGALEKLLRTCPLCLKVHVRQKTISKEQLWASTVPETLEKMEEALYIIFTKSKRCLSTPCGPRNTLNLVQSAEKAEPVF